MLGVPGLFNAYRDGQRRARQRHRHRRRRRQGHLCLRARASSATTWPRRPSWKTSRPSCCRDENPEVYARALDQLVVKAVGESGGYGMLMGPTAPGQREAFRLHRWPTRATTSPSRRSNSHVALLHRRPVRIPACGSAALHPLRREDRDPARRPDPRGPAPRLAGRQLIARGRQQGYLGVVPSEGSGISMLSRVADNLYWMSRYLERAEHTAPRLSTWAPGARPGAFA